VRDNDRDATLRVSYSILSISPLLDSGSELVAVSQRVSSASAA